MPSNVGLNPDLNMFEHVEYISSDFSCTSSINSSRSGMGMCLILIIRILVRLTRNYFNPI